MIILICFIFVTFPWKYYVNCAKKKKTQTYDQKQFFFFRFELKYGPDIS